MITSYAQNFEDVMLWRALQHVVDGFYIDVGAQHPIIDSVSKAFYERGWRGIHVEPTTTYASLLRQDRPEETVLQAALSFTHGTLTFFEIPETGLSTADATIAERHRQQGFEIRDTTVPSLTLRDVFERAGTRDIHWLKIDVEGFERQVLEGWGNSRARPWIVVVESTLPLTTIESHTHWERLLRERDYAHVYFDGLNRYYISAEHPELHDAFRAGPNVFDDFALNGTANASFCRLVQERHKAEISNLQTESDRAKRAAQEEAARLAEALATQKDHQSQREQALAEQLRAANDVIQQLNSKLVEAGRTGNEKEQSLLRDHTAKLESLHHQLQASQTELRQVAQEAVARERELTRDAAEIRQEVEELLRTLLQREKEFSQELEQSRRSAEQTLADRFQAHQAELRQLAQAGIERENMLTQQNLLVRQEMEAVLRLLAQREREFAQELLQARREAEQAHTEQRRTYAERERSLRREQAEREDRLNGQISQLGSELVELRHSLEQRESAFAHELQQVRLEALEAAHEQVRLLVAREEALRRQLLASQEEQRNAEARAHDREKQLGGEISSKQRELIQLAQAHAVHEAQLREQLVAQQRAVDALRQHIEATQSSMVWRLTQQLRRFSSTFGSRSAPPNLFQLPAPPIVVTENHIETHARVAAPTEISSATINMNPTLSAKTVAELLSYHDRQFIQSAYITLLGRLPDTEGEIYYLGRLHSGYHKASVLAQIASSKEAQACGVKLPGLDSLIAEQRRATHWLWRILDRGARLERHGNRLEHELGRISERLEHINAQQRDLAEHVHHLDRTITGLLANPHERAEVAAPAAPTTAATSTHASQITPVEEEIDLAGLSLPAKRIFVELGKAVAAARAEGEQK
ncbi:FkbM family methyltransferase [Ralstonia flatus]|uniref:FkbM family methyltransferase n=1 Tax=Ralstonia flatus TaxID=3058601 RepID=A0AAD2C3B7_9RALS|nr:FkbM family methyltransferase [Ralstonia sp. LMG 32965]MBN6209038.1 FkbM family methyltransferase [Ralstonia pickettii]CAJ0891341.1 hypothetical protein R77567_04266 [Ralstonia sp. LMG 32965]CAJ0897704.1 hypothetical protein R77564_04132 [Ralstonia sp. LMG 32965]